MKQQQREKIKQIADFYGIEKQLCNTLRKDEDLYTEIVDYRYMFEHSNENIKTDRLIDKIASMKIEIAKLSYLLECGQEVKDRVEFKLNSQIGRMEEERGNY